MYLLKAISATSYSIETIMLKRSITMPLTLNKIIPMRNINVRCLCINRILCTDVPIKVSGFVYGS